MIEFKQASGKPVTLKVLGDELYARTTTKDGYTVIYDSPSRTYYYATKAANGVTLVKTKTPANEAPPAGVTPNLTESKEVASAIRKANIKKYIPDQAANWDAKVKAYTAKKAAAAASASGRQAAAPLNAAQMAQAAPVIGAKVGLAILVQFPNDPQTAGNDPTNFPATQVKMDRYFNQLGYTDDGNTGSVREYFSDQSLGALTFTQSVTQIITLPQPRNFYNYSNYPTNTVERDAGATGNLLVQDAIAILRANNYNFSNLTVDAAGNVVSTSILFAGADSGVWSKGLWPHAWLVTPRIDVGGRYISRYQCTNVDNAAPVIGTNCHELGHLLLGYPDLYDTDGGSEGVGEHCLMGSANHLNGGKTPGPIDLFLKEISGWAIITVASYSGVTDVNIPTTGNIGYRVRKPGISSEYFLLENRGPGDRWAAFSPDQGILIWHIDEAVTTDNMREEMTELDHYQVSVEQADGQFHLETDWNRGDNEDCFDVNANNQFNDFSIPDAHWWDGVPSTLSLAVLSSPGPVMTVRFGATPDPTQLGVYPPSNSVLGVGAMGLFRVTSNATWKWTKTVPWVVSAEPTTQGGSQEFRYVVAANTTGLFRSTDIVLTSGSQVRRHTIFQSPAFTDDHGNFINRATLIDQNSTTNGTIEISGDYDYFKINVTVGGTLNLYTTGDFDTYGHLYNAGGTELITNDDGGLGVNFYITYPVKVGTYYVRVRAWNPTDRGNYQLVSFLSANPTLTVYPATETISAQGGFIHCYPISDTDWTWSCDSDWVTAGEPWMQNGTQQFTYYVSANSTAASRSANITFLSTYGISVTHTVTQAASNLADLANTGTRQAITPAQIIPSGTMAISGDVINQGVVPSGSFVVKYYLSADTQINASDYLLGTKAIASINAAGSSAFDMTGLKVPANIRKGIYYAGWILDATGGVAEISETNNTGYIKNFTVNVGNVTSPMLPLPAPTAPTLATALEGSAGTAVQIARVDSSLSSTFAGILPQKGSVPQFNYERSVASVNSGVSYSVEWAASLDESAVWSSNGVVQTVTSDDGVQQQVTATLPAGTNPRFVRVKTITP